MRFLLILLCLAACDSPSPRMMGGDRAEMRVGGKTYVVYRKGPAFEVIRMDRVAHGGHDAVRVAMLGAVAQATGCTPVAASVAGDSGVMRGRLDCP